MSDFKVSALFETNAPQVERDVGKVADSLDRVGSSAAAASRGTDELATASGRLAKARADAAIADERVAKMQDRSDASRPRVIANMNEYNRALNEQMQARVRLAKAIKDGQVAQDRAAATTPRPTVAVGGSRGLSRGDVAIGAAAGTIGANLLQSAASATLEFVKGSVDEASKLTDTLSTNRDVFGQYAGDVDRFGKTAASSLGLSRQAAVETADAFGQTFRDVGVGDQTAAHLSTRLTGLGVDLAAFKHEADPGNAFHALQQAITGRTDELHRYGLVLTTATVQGEAFKLGLIRTRTEGLTPQARALAVTALVTEQAHTQTGAFARSSEELGGKQRTLAANIKDAQAELGKGLLPAMTGAAAIANGTLIPVLAKLGQAIGFLGEHDSTRHFAELAIGLYAIKKATDGFHAAQRFLIGDTADVVAASAAKAAAYTAEGDAAAIAAEKVAALDVAEHGRKPPAVPLVKGAAVKTGIVAAGYAVGSLGYAAVNSSERDKLSRGEHLRGVHTIGPDTRAYNELALHYLGHGVDFATSLFGVNGAGKAIDRGTGYSDDMAANDRYNKDAGRRAEAAQAAEEARYSPAHRAALATEGRAQLRKATADYNVRDARAYLDSRSYVKDAASIPLGGLFDALPEKPDQSVVQNAREEQRAARAAFAIAQARVTKARAGAGGASAGQIASAQAAVLTAQDAVRKRGGDAAAEQLRLQAAEAHLAQLRQGGKTDTVALMTAENGLETARARQRKAAEALHKAEKEASGDKSLTLQEVLARATHAAGTSTAEVGNVRTLVRAGVSAPVIAELEQLEQTAPGTMARVAKGITPAFVKQLNADQAARDKAAIDLAKLGGEAKLKAAEAEAAKSGKALGDAMTAAISAAIKDPGWLAQARTALSGLLLPAGGGGKTVGPQPSGDLPQQALTPGVAAGVTTPPAAPTHAPAAAGPSSHPAGSRTTNYNLNGPVIASDPATLHHEMKNRASLAKLGSA